MAKTTGSSNTRSGSTSYQQTASQGGSDTHSEYGSVSNTRSHSSTDSYSQSHSQGGSKSQTAGESASQSASQGGNKSVSAGQTWASGQVSDRTQQKYNQATQDYVRSQKVDDAYANLQNAISQRPQFQSKFEDKLNGMYESLMNRPGFTYDFNKDAMYRQYRDMYQTQGKRAMQDTMGQLAAMNSGYGSSYAQSAGQQTYQNYLQQLNDRIPELRQQALDEYDRENNRLMQMYGLTKDAYDREYGQYRNDVSDWQADRSYNQSAYQDERNFDYQKAQNDRNFWQNEYWQERNAAHSNLQTSEGTNWNTGTSYSRNRSQTDSQNWSDSETRGHSETDTNSTTETNGWQNSHTSSWNNSTTTGKTTGWSNTNSSSSSSGSGGGSGSRGSGGSVPYSESSSLDFYQEARRESDIDQMASYLKDNNQKELGKMVVDLLDKGTQTGSGKNKTTVTYEPQDVANLLNEADARNNRRSDNGSTYHTNNFSESDVKQLYNQMKNKNYNYWG